MTFIPSGLRKATTGEAWILTHHIRGQRGAFLETDEFIGVYTDPQQAIHELAERIRPYWPAWHERATRTRRPPLPTAPPRDAFAAVALFFADPGEETRAGFQTFNLELHTIDATTPPVGPEHILLYPYQEFLCVCGNHAAASGFEARDATGTIRPSGPDEGWSGHYLCVDCRRIIRADTGLVIARA